MSFFVILFVKKSNKKYLYCSNAGGDKGWQPREEGDKGKRDEDIEGGMVEEEDGGG